MSNKQQSSIEWYNQQIVDRQNGNGDSRSIDEIFQQAKEMEKEQIKNAWVSAWQDSMLKPLEYKFYEPEAESYYNETYGGNKWKQY